MQIRTERNCRFFREAASSLAGQVIADDRKVDPFPQSEFGSNDEAKRGFPQYCLKSQKLMSPMPLFHHEFGEG
jgi:hypothetical protein